MRTRTIARWRRAALGGVMAASLVARGQEQQQPAGGETAPVVQPKGGETAPVARPKGGETEPVVTEQSPRPPPAGDIQPVPGSPEEYTIQKGDTLWDLSQKFLNNPWYWPKIWSQNPSIENPHWIYPGNHLRIVPGQGGAQAPAQVQAEGQPGEMEAPPDDTGGATAAGGTGTPDVEVVSREGQGGGRGSSAVSVTGKLAFTPPPVVAVRASGLISPEEMQGSGSIDASFEEREMLSTYDTAYVRFKGEAPAKPGDKLVLFRSDGQVVHPVTHRKLADKTKNVGVVKVLSVRGPIVTVQIESVFEEIERGDRVRAWTPPTMRIAPRPNTQDVQGVVVSAVNAGLSTYGEANEVFIDKGSADGVQEGNTFAVVRHGDGLNNRLVGDYGKSAGVAGARAAGVATPDENVGLLLVTETKEHLSTAIVVKSIRELEAGDHVEMRATGAGGGGP